VFLSNESTQDKMAQSMFEAFKKYKSELEGVDEIKGEKKNVNNEVKREDSIQSSQQTEIEIKNTSIDKKNVIIFKVQIETSDKQISSNVKRFNGLEVEEIQEGKIYKYVTGSFENDFVEANKLKNELRSNGFPLAFVVAYEDGVRMDLEKAKLESKKK
jgi:N-acetylmuramoyl-L-alanine amidase